LRLELDELALLAELQRLEEGREEGKEGRRQGGREMSRKQLRENGSSNRNREDELYELALLAELQ
jgi:hypothetical protein